MSAIRSKGRRGHTAVPNWRISDTTLDPYEFRIAAWIASHTDNYCEEYVTRNAIARDTGVSAGKVTLALKRLVGLEIIEMTTGQPRNRLVIDFDHDAWEANPLVTTRPVTGHDMTGDRSPHDQSTALHLYIGEDQGEEQTEALSPHADDFEHFWQTYPRRIDKQRAWKAFQHVLKTEPFDEIIFGTMVWANFWERDRTEDRFIPHPSTWLRNERWKVPPPAPREGTKSERAMAAIERLAASGDDGPKSLADRMREINP